MYNNLLKILLAAAISFAGTLKAQTVSSFAATISPADLREKLAYIAGPETEGRASATPGQRKAAAYIEDHFRKAGLLPGTPGGYQMVFPLYQDTLLHLVLSVNGKALQVQNDFAYSLNNLPVGHTTAGDVVFVRYGIEDSASSDYRNVDVKGKWVMVAEGLAARPGNNRTFPGYANAINMLKARIAASKGAKGLLVVSKDFPREGSPAVQNNKYVEQNRTSIPVFNISLPVASSILKRGLDSISQLLALPHAVHRANVHSEVVKFKKTHASTNVLGLLPGTDKKDEYLVLTAHYDHLGMHNGVVHPGADDDGSGIVAILEMAEAFAQAKAEGKGPRRSIVFMAVSGEEMGLLGSEFYSEHPVYPMEKTTANLNIDMIGRITPNYNGDSTNYVYLIGDHRLSSELTPIADSANKAVGLQLDRRYNLNDPSRYYERSDHYHFARKGVPIIFFFNGTHPDYHRPGDTIDKINFDLLSRRAQLVFHTAWIMANRDEMVKRDLPF